MMQKEKIEHKDDLKIEIVSEKDREILVTRSFSAPRELVFKAMTDPEHVRHWRGPRSMPAVVCEADLRVGGTWRVVQRGPDGVDHTVSGVFREFQPPQRLVRTSNYANVPGTESLETLTFEEHNGRTTVATRIRFSTDRQYSYYLTSTAQEGARESYERLDEHLDKIS